MDLEPAGHTVYDLTDVFCFNTEPSTNVSHRSNAIIGNTAAPPGGTSTSSHTLCGTADLCNGTNAIIGTPSFVGGSPSTISTLAGWQPTAGSLGKGAGHDGQDVGVVLGRTQAAPAPPTNLRIVR